MTDPIEPTPGDGGNAPTPEPKKAVKPEITPEIQAIIDKAVTSRLDREQKAHAKEKAELEAKLKEYEDKDLGEVDKLQKKIEKLTKDLSDKDGELTGVKLRIAKTDALLAAGALSEQIPKLIKRVSGNTEEEILADVEELKTIGWIGQPPQPDPAKPAANGAGKPPVKDGGLKKFTKAQLKDKAFYEANREDILKAMAAGLIT